MNITEYKLTITYKTAFEDDEKVKELIYRGNQDVIISETPSPDVSINEDVAIRVPRHVLECFMRLINES